MDASFSVILHFVQDDKRAARDDKRRARDDKGEPR